MQHTALFAHVVHLEELVLAYTAVMLTYPSVSFLIVLGATTQVFWSFTICPLPTAQHCPLPSHVIPHSAANCSWLPQPRCGTLYLHDCKTPHLFHCSVTSWRHFCLMSPFLPNDFTTGIWTQLSNDVSFALIWQFIVFGGHAACIR